MDEQEEHKHYEIEIRGDGVSIKRFIDERIALSIIQIILGGTPQIIPTGQTAISGLSGHTDLPIGTTPIQLPPTNRMSLRGYIDEVGAKNIATKIVAIGAFMQHFENKNEFTREEIGDKFREAGEPRPTNLPRDFQTAIAKAWIAEDPKKKGAILCNETRIRRYRW